MKKVFRDKNQLECIFTEEGISFYGAKQEVSVPYGAIDSINMSLLGILQVTHRAQVFTFTVARGDKAEMKEMIRYAREAMGTAPKEELKIIDRSAQAGLVDSSLPPEEQLKQYKTLFIQGQISKDEYDLKKRQLR